MSQEPLSPDYGTDERGRALPDPRLRGSDPSCEFWVQMIWGNTRYAAELLFPQDEDDPGGTA